MHTPREAIAEILAAVSPLRASEEVALATCTGRVLAREVVSDLDLPPFRKSAMDGFAVRSADLQHADGEHTLPIVGESRAGEPFAGGVPEGSAVAIYTGAEVPDSLDSVVMVEDTERLEGEPQRVRIPAEVRAGQHVCERGEDLGVGERVFGPGHRVRAIDLSALAAVGCDPVPVVVRPRVSILTTGDELIAPSAQPGPGQIREGNTIQLAARVEAAGGEARNLGVVPDDEVRLEQAFVTALESSDVLVTTGGVSVGRYDLVGATLEKLGVQPIFHKIAIKPGKPLWFGKWNHVPVFALPGNPVSSLVGHEIFVRPALARMGGASDDEVEPAERRARWNGAETAPNWREQYVPAVFGQGRDGNLFVEPVPWNGSGDVAGLTRANALAVLPPDRSVARGEWVLFRAFD